MATGRLITGKNGNDSISDTNYDRSEIITINSGKGNDYISIGYHTNASVFGSEGNDTIDNFRYAHDSTLNGGSGNDYIISKESNSLLIIGGTGNDTIISSSWATSINSGKGNDLISLQSASNLISYAAGDGNDTIYGFNSTDSIKITGTTYSTTKSGSDIIIKAGSGRIYLKNSVGNAVQINGKNVADKSTNKKLVILTDKDDYFNGNLDDITISGGKGNDYISNGDGLDKHSYSKNVSISGGAGDDFIGISCEEEHFPYKLVRSPDNSTLNGGTGNDTILNSEGKNVLFQYKNGDGNDLIWGFNDTSTLSIGGSNYSTKKSGSDVIVTVGKGKITLTGAANLSKINIKSDYRTIMNATKSPVTVNSAIRTINASTRTKAAKITGNSLANTIQGGSGNDTLLGGAGNDKLYGNAGADKLYGGKGNDTLTGGKGNDSLWGDAGKDTFIYANGDGKDVIFGFDNTDMLKITGKFSTSYNKSKKEIYFKVGSTANAITLKDFSATSFNVNGTSYKISGSKLVKK